MHIIRRTRGIDPRAKTAGLHGHVELLIKDATTGKIRERITGDNMLTNGLNNALNECPFGLDKRDTGMDTIGGTYLETTPIYSQLLGGIFMFPQALGNNADLLFPPFSNSPVGFASMSDYTQEDSRQGTFDAVASGVITNGFKYSYGWGPSYGNGTIASLGLSTRNAHTWCKNTSNMFKPFQLNSGSIGFSSIKPSGSRILSIAEQGTLLTNAESRTYDYIYFFKQQKPYTVGILEHLRFEDLDTNNPYSNTNRNGYTWKVENTWASTSIPIRYTTQIVGSYVYIITHTDGTFTVRKLNIADGSLASTDTYTFSGSFGSGNAVLYGNYIYCGASTANKILKCNTQNTADVTEVTATGLAANSDLFFVNTQFIYTTNGILDAESDIFESTNNPITYALDQWFSYPVAEYGSWLLFNSGSYISAVMKQWGLMTHYDLQNAVTKDATKTLTVNYSITQA